jgi:hypothetical protein
MKSEIIYLDDDRNAVEKEDATQYEIIEYGDDGKVANRTYGDIDNSADIAEIIGGELDEDSLQELIDSLGDKK